MATAVRAAAPVDFATYAMTQQGDVAAGRVVFNAQGSMCAACHTVDGSGTKVGPDLSAVGDKFGKKDLIRAVIEPGAEVAVGFATTTVTLKSGGSRVGVIRAISDKGIDLIGVDGAISKISSEEVASRETNDVSLMPPGLHLGMEPQGFADLIAYLESLRAEVKEGNDASPAVIPMSRGQARLEPLFDLKFDHPTLFGWVPETRERSALVLEHAGRIRAVEGIGSSAESTPFLDLSSKVKPSGATGLMGLAFHPFFEKNRRYYLQYQVMEEGTTYTIIEERTMKAGQVEDSGQAAREVIKIRAATLDHCGGDIRFGRDGYLYFGMGDTGPHRDPQGHAQEMGLLLGKMLRIDVDKRDGGLGYGIPADNPYVGVEGVRPEIWASGFRNPYRFSWDLVTGDLWLADVGQNKFEEIDIVRRGGNYGWNVYEGFDAFSDQYRRDGESYVAPIMSYGRNHGVSVTGGLVYRGSRQPLLQGSYLFGDYESRRIWALRQDGGKFQSVVEIARAPSRITAFTPDGEGEVVVTCFDDGRIYRLMLDDVDPRPAD
ncbi:PQQ-dependent sugar dehydrogenase [Luteolibacter marinus]|uniref:PQQ-dependent sugar dehydrogenase n=1 Tax=Luteolibacter marinus TaxID=2776705 RepID=UPI001868CB2B|nr:PQQ-dependent sugar dehydrogenase [Luteolibacter marinus]